LKSIFLSAGTPDKSPWSAQADSMRIREAITALVAVWCPTGTLVFGGHPAISPLVEHTAQALGCTENVHIFQSRFFMNIIPPEASAFKNFHWTDVDSTSSRDASLQVMRQQMLDFCNPCFAGVFIGGMEGVILEFELFRQRYPQEPVFPVASTGAAARVILENTQPANPQLQEMLSTEPNPGRQVGIHSSNGIRPTRGVSARADARGTAGSSRTRGSRSR
jgi:hypothetical protein